MKLFDKVYIIKQFEGYDQVPGIIVDVVGDFLIVDTIIGGTFKVAPKHLELIPEPKAIIELKGKISEKQLRNFKKQWESCLKNRKSVAKTPIIGDLP